MRKRFAILLSLSLIITYVPFIDTQNASANVAKTQTTSSSALVKTVEPLIGNENGIEKTTNIDISSAQDSTTIINVQGSSSLSDSYLSNYVTSVKNQYNTSLCWAYAASAASESNLYKNGLAGSNINLSEKQLAYNVFNASVSDGDYVDTLGSSDFNYSGSFYYTVAVLSSLLGPNTETSANEITSLTNLNKASLSATSSEGFNLDEAEWIDSGNLDAVKQAIVNYGAGTMSIYYPTTSKEENAYLNGSAIYQGTYSTTNHMITVVGWDDDYSASNFATRPAGNGAWIIKNSWGTGAGDGGYYYVSYYDTGVLSQPVVFYGYESASYDNENQYDGGIITASISLSNGSNVLTDVYTANVFEADSDETLGQVGFYTLSEDVTCKISVYATVKKDSSSNTAAFSDLLGSTVSVTEANAGYHTVDLPEGMKVSANESYAVVVELSDSNGVAIPEECTYNMGSTSYCVYGTSNKGESYYGTSVSNMYDNYSSANGQSGSSGNLRIKVFTNETSSSISAPTEQPEETTAQTQETTTVQTVEPAATSVADTETSVPEATTSTTVAPTATAKATVAPTATAKTTVAPTATTKTTKSASTTVTPARTSTTTTSNSSAPTLSQSDVTLAIGLSVQLSVENTSATIKWRSSDTSVATVTDGKVTIVSAGVAIISATIGDSYLTCYVTGTNPVISKTKAKVKVNKKIVLSVTGGAGSVKWSVNKKGVTVKNGLVKAKKKGKYTIKAVVDGKTLKCKLTVK